MTFTTIWSIPLHLHAKRMAAVISCTTILSVLSACESSEVEKVQSSTSKTLTVPNGGSPKPKKTPVQPKPRPSSPPTVLLELNESAYGKSLVVQGDNIYLATQSALYRFSPNGVSSKTALDLGYNPAFAQHQIIYWSAGALYSVPIGGGTVRQLSRIARQPIQIVASKDRFAWLERNEAGNDSLRVLKGKSAPLLYESPGKLSSLTMIQDWVFFVEQSSDRSWHLGALPVGGTTPPSFGPRHLGRTPSMLASSKREIYYFDLPSRSIRRVLPDFSSERTIAQKLICSPLAVSDRIFCARVEGIFEQSFDGKNMHPLTMEPLGLVTTIAASESRVAWINDSGRNKLTLRSLPVPQIEKF